jgi:excinuclease UvrABC nuclease subunit
VSEVQLRLLPSAKPLDARFGPAFFRAVPKVPGVYTMRDSSSRVIYVGQSKNLRQRLSSYRHLRPERCSRRLIRLVHAVENIAWEECASAEAALLRENQLLRELRPRFNSANVYPKAAVFIGYEWDGRFLRLTIGTQTPDLKHVFGAFKSGASRSFAALLRRLHAALHPDHSIQDFPHRFFSDRPPRAVRFQTTDDGLHRVLAESLRDWLSGAKDEFLQQLRDAGEQNGAGSTFEKQAAESDLELLSEFFLRAARRNHEMRARWNIAGLIGQEQLNDLLVQERFVPTAVT